MHFHGQDLQYSAGGVTGDCNRVKIRCAASQVLEPTSARWHLDFS